MSVAEIDDEHGSGFVTPRHFLVLDGLHQLFVHVFGSSAHGPSHKLIEHALGVELLEFCLKFRVLLVSSAGSFRLLLHVLGLFSLSYVSVLDLKFPVVVSPLVRNFEGGIGLSHSFEVVLVHS